MALKNVAAKKSAQIIIVIHNAIKANVRSHLPNFIELTLKMMIRRKRKAIQNDTIWLIGFTKN